MSHGGLVCGWRCACGNLSAEVVVFLPFLVVDQVFRHVRRENPEFPSVRRSVWLGLFQHVLPWWGPRLAFRDLARPSFYTVHLSADDLPISCDGAVDALPPEQRMLTSRLWGNWQIWRFPNRPVFSDGAIANSRRYCKNSAKP